jgi:hypothetical protein
MKMMKMHSLISRFLSRVPRRARLGAGTVVLAAAGAVAFTASDAGDYVAHEWGTFTSVQGTDGALMDWRPLATSDLPKFVHDWTRPGLNRQSPLLSTKAALVTRQRMETPVIYFYAKKEIEVDVTVKFPQGKITEWYPQAKQIGPAQTPTPALVTKLDAGVHQVGVKPEFTFASLLPQRAAKDSRIFWSDVKILPAERHPEVAQLVPRERSESHYYPARETDAAFVQVDSLSRTNPGPEHDRFLFYRGAGNFTTPLVVTSDPDSTLTLTNTGSAPLSHLFVLRVRDGRGNFVALDSLSASSQRSVSFDPDQPLLPLPELSRALGSRVANALVREGLFPREAQAMVNTWKDSWFVEEGMRVLYTLPREWTDATLPITLDPLPKELVRVMVGRAEVITPAMQQELARSIVAAESGEAGAKEEAEAVLKRFGRFAEPALQLATDSAAPELRQAGWKLLQAMNERATQKRL